MNQGQVPLPSFSVSMRFSERSRNWRYWRPRRFSTCLIWFPARDRKLQGRRGTETRLSYRLLEEEEGKGGGHQVLGSLCRQLADKWGLKAL